MLPLLYLWDKKAMYLGPGLDSSDHSHNMYQLIIALDGETKVKTDDIWSKGTVFLIKPNQIHATALFGKVAMLFIEPDLISDSSMGSFLDLSFELKEKLKKCLNHPLDYVEAEHLHDLILSEFCLRELRNADLDERIKICLGYIDRNLRSDLKMKDVCFAGGLSESTFSHLFSKEVGISFRRYVIWKRIRLAISIFTSRKISLTNAALEVGFNDQAHFNRSFKDIFGVTPGFVLGRKLKILYQLNRLIMAESDVSIDFDN
jgi:AraC-like DNA-binding protein